MSEQEKPTILVHLPEKEPDKQSVADLDLIKEVLGTPERVKGVMTLIKQLEEKDKRKLPPGYSLKSNPSYYREKYAYEVKRILDPLIKEDGTFHYKDLVIDYRKMHSLNKATLYQRIVMGWKYLVDHLDPRGVYKEIRSQTKCKHEHRGIAIRWRSNLLKYLGTESLANATTEIPVGEETITWKKDLEEFIVSAENNQVFKKTGILLTDGQMDIIKGMLKDMPGFIPVTISRNKIVIMYNESIEKWDGTQVPQ